MHRNITETHHCHYPYNREFTSTLGLSRMLASVQDKLYLISLELLVMRISPRSNPKNENKGQTNQVSYQFMR